MTPPIGFSTLTPLPGLNANELPPITASTFTAKTLENVPLTNRTSTLDNLDPMISPAFVEANYEVLESILRERRRRMRNEDLRTKLEYFSEVYDEEREMEPRPTRAREATLILQVASLRIQRQKERAVEFEDAPNKEGGRVERNDEGGRPLGQRTKDNEPQQMNLPPLLAAHLERSENGQPLQSSLTFVHGDRHPWTNIGGNHLSCNAQPFILNNIQLSNGPMPVYVNPYSQPNMGTTYGQPMSHPSQTRGGRSSFEGPPIYYSHGGYALQAPTGSSIPVSHGLIHPSGVFPNSYPFHAQSMYPSPNAPIYPNHAPSGLFADYTGRVTLFVCWIKDYPLPDGLKMPSHVRSYDGKGHPNNF
ncbi:hypothetical protein Tco_0406985 [Tanacetum coccineum]